eukprot:scaffold944_cov333-Pavlova_lutheri.AAC.17
MSSQPCVAPEVAASRRGFARVHRLVEGACDVGTLAGEPSDSRTEPGGGLADAPHAELRTRTGAEPSVGGATASRRHVGRPLRGQRPAAQDLRGRGGRLEPPEARPGRLRSTCERIHRSRRSGRDPCRDVPAGFRVERGQVSQPQADPRDRRSAPWPGHGHRRRAEDEEQRIPAVQGTAGRSDAQTDRKLGRAGAGIHRAGRLGVRIRTLDDVGSGGAPKRRIRVVDQLRNHHRTRGPEVGQESHRRPRVLPVHRHALPKGGRDLQEKSERRRIPREGLHVRTQRQPRNQGSNR